MNETQSQNAFFVGLVTDDGLAMFLRIFTLKSYNLHNLGILMNVLMWNEVMTCRALG